MDGLEALKSTPLTRGDLGYGWTCPYCEQVKTTDPPLGTYYHGFPVCETCAPILQERRDAARRTVRMDLAGGGGLKHPEERYE